jgi:NTE family protein
MSPEKPPVERALILSGGGARGAYQVGVWRRLQEMGWQPDLVCGTSIGALNGTLIGMGWDAGRLETFWESLQRKQIFRISFRRRMKYFLGKLLGRHPGWRPALMDNLPMRHLLEPIIDERRLRESATEVIVTATNVCRAQLEYFSSDVLTIDHMMASCAIPVVFPWQEIGGELYWDGGIMANTPVFPALQRNAREIVVVLLAPLVGNPVAPPKTTRAASAWSFDIITIASARALGASLAQHLGMDLQASAEAINRQHFLDFGDTRVGVVAPTTPSGLASVLDMDPRGVKTRIAAGYSDACQQLTGFFGTPKSPLP